MGCAESWWLWDMVRYGLSGLHRLLSFRCLSGALGIGPDCTGLSLSQGFSQQPKDSPSDPVSPNAFSSGAFDALPVLS